jgi:oligopeptide/dipeptide ABC transporter ATP-binding protein
MEPLIELRNVDCRFKVGKRNLPVLDQVSLRFLPSEIVCLVGESGCGKTTTGKVIAGLLAPVSGQVLFKNQAVQNLTEREKKQYRLGVQMIHQDPYASLNPTQSVFEIISTPLYRHRFVSNEKEALKRVSDLLCMVDLTPPENFLYKYPHQLSGGQRQRVSIARSITVQPSLIVADEAVSMVDVSIRISILKMMKRFRDELGMAFVLITHDLALAKYFAGNGRIVVMYLGKIVEIAQASELVTNPRHPYTRALISALPEADPNATRRKERFELRSMDVPSLFDKPPGCVFHPRCPLYLESICEQEAPPQVSFPDGVMVACHLFSDMQTRKEE